MQDELTLGRVLIPARKKTAKEHQRQTKGDKACAEGGDKRQPHQQRLECDSDVLGNR